MAEVELQIERQRDLSDLDSPTVREKGRERASQRVCTCAGRRESPKNHPANPQESNSQNYVQKLRIAIP